MKLRALILNLAVASALALAVPAPALADDRTADLLARLADPDEPRWQRLERELLEHWSKSGSAAMDLLLRRGRDALEAGEFAKAIDHLTAAIDHDPEFAEAWHARASAYFRAGAYGPAMADLAMALALNPAHFGALSGLGAILEDTGRLEQALAAYRAAHAIHPRQPDIRRALERVELMAGGLDT